MWLCRCDCGNFVKKSTGKIRDKNNKNNSCGCAKVDSMRIAQKAALKVTTKYFHPLKRKIFGCKRRMISRCYNPNDTHYKWYGARGITVCEEWRGPRANFYNWALSAGYSAGLTIERIDVNAGYCPENCCFIPSSQQQINTTRNSFLEWGGERMTISQWARKMGVRPQALQHRISRKWSIEKIFTQPFRGKP